MTKFTKLMWLLATLLLCFTSFEGGRLILKDSSESKLLQVPHTQTTVTSTTTIVYGIVCTVDGHQVKMSVESAKDLACVS